MQGRERIGGATGFLRRGGSAERERQGASGRKHPNSQRDPPAHDPSFAMKLPRTQRMRQGLQVAGERMKAGA